MYNVIRKAFGKRAITIKSEDLIKQSYEDISENEVWPIIQISSITGKGIDFVK